MTLEQLALIAQIIGVVVVAATLIYLDHSSAPGRAADAIRIATSPTRQ